MGFLGFTQAVGNLSNYFGMFFGIITILILIGIIIVIINNKNWPPPCPKEGKPEGSCASPKSTVISVLIAVILIGILILFLRYRFRNNKIYQTVLGAGTELNAVRRIGKII